jgi:hypothetical protein
MKLVIGSVLLLVAWIYGFAEWHGSACYPFVDEMPWVQGLYIVANLFFVAVGAYCLARGCAAYRELRRLRDKRHAHAA